MENAHLAKLPIEVWERILRFPFGDDMQTVYDARYEEWLSMIKATLLTCKTMYQLASPVFLRQIDMGEKPSAVIMQFLNHIPSDHLALVKRLLVRMTTDYRCYYQSDEERLQCVATLLIKLTQLTYLRVDYQGPLGTRTCDAICSKGATLTELDLRGQFIRGEAVAQIISALPRIRHLRLQGVTGLDSFPLGPAIASLAHLDSLHLINCQAVEDSWADLDWKNGSNMLQLSLEELYELTPFGFARLVSVFSKRLRQLVLYATPASLYDEDARREVPLDDLPTIDAPHLESLLLGNCARNEMLPFTVFQHCPLTKLDLFDVNVDAMHNIVEQFERGKLSRCRWLKIGSRLEYYGGVASLAIPLMGDRTVAVQYMPGDEDEESLFLAGYGSSEYDEWSEDWSEEEEGHSPY